MVSDSDPRASGSAEDFEADWREALRTGDPRWLIYPDATASDQVSLTEWVKADQVLSILRRYARPGARVLEYGCGAAGMSIFLQSRDYACVALDRSTLALTVAAHNQHRHAAQARPLPSAAGDALTLPFPSGAFDVVMSYGLLEHFDDAALADLLTESVRVLTPGGLFIADVVPGRPNARTVGLIVSFAASAAAHVLRGRAHRLPALWREYFDHYFENALPPAEWERALLAAGLTGVRVRVCRPFPPLALSGRAERAYVRLMRWALPAWRRFEASSSPLARAWGWMYLCWGAKPRTDAA